MRGSVYYQSAELTKTFKSSTRTFDVRLFIRLDLWLSVYVVTIITKAITPNK